MSRDAMNELRSWLGAESSRACALRHTSGRFAVSLSTLHSAQRQLVGSDLEDLILLAIDAHTVAELIGRDEDEATQKERGAL